MLEPDPLATLTEALKALRPSTPTDALKPPMFDWKMTEQYEDFCLFCKSVESWYHLQGMKEEPDNGTRLEYLLNFLGTTGHGNMSNGNLQVPPKKTTRIRRKALLNSSNTSLPQWITLCLNGAGSISWKMSVYAQVKPPMSS